MKVLLRENIENLGERGAIVDVKSGYARNYLLPRRLAVPATAVNFRQLDIERARIAKLAEKERAERETLRTRLDAASCTIVAASSPEGHLYGSVGPKEIAAALSKEGFALTDANIRLEEPFKEAGVYVVEIALAHDLVAQSRIWIVPE